MDAWRPRLAVICNVELIARIVAFADADDRVVARFSCVGREVWIRQRDWIHVTHALWVHFVDHVYDEWEEQARAREIRDELDWRDYIAGEEVCICNAVARGWAFRCDTCSRIDWD